MKTEVFLSALMAGLVLMASPAALAARESERPVRGGSEGGGALKPDRGGSEGGGALKPDRGGSEGGGGGNAVVCFNDPAIPLAFRDPSSPRYGKILDHEIASAITLVETYDLYEARMPRGLDARVQKFTTLLEGETPRQYVERIARRFAPYVPDVSRILRQGSGAFSDQRILMRPDGLTRIQDEADVGPLDSKLCVVATMAAQYNAGVVPQLQIDSRLFNHPKHSAFSRAVLFLHEVIYFMARTHGGQTDSRATRVLVGRLINAEPVDSFEIVSLLQSLQILGDKKIGSVLEDTVEHLYEHYLRPVRMKAMVDEVLRADVHPGVSPGDEWGTDSGQLLVPELIGYLRAEILKIAEREVLRDIEAMKGLDAGAKRDFRIILTTAIRSMTVSKLYLVGLPGIEGVSEINLVIR